MLVCLKEMRTEAIYLRLFFTNGLEVIEDLTIIDSSVFSSMSWDLVLDPYHTVLKFGSICIFFLLFFKYICIVLEMQHLSFCLSDGWKLEKNIVLVFIFAVFEC